MVLRLYARIFVVKALGPDDILMVFAAILSWAFIIATILAVENGLGDHIEVVVAKGTITTYAQIVWFSSIFYNACLGFIKISVLSLYARLGDRTLKKMAFVMVVIVASSATANVLVCIFQCSPIAAAWNSAITEKTCVNINAFYLANAGTNIATDVMTYMLPWNTVRKLQIPKKQKIAVGVMLCLGLFACISSIVRITTIPRMLSSSDSTYVISEAMYWSVIETNIGILAASIPSFKPLVKRYLPRILGEYSGSNRGRTGSNGPFTGKSGNKSGFSKLSAGTYNGARSNSASYYGRDLKGAHSMTTSISGIENDNIELGHHKTGATPRADSDEFGHNPDSNNSSQERIIVQTPSPGYAVTGNGQNSGRIMRTTEVTSSVEGGTLPQASMTSTAYGNARSHGPGQW
ncbi:putative integral membrane protein [Phaeomoniella chlamydospora]|uniref:Putative integral membrane protein n=1 Tax=Phaeomoniella chlamydospora TaxID=158046 RepID=A0A0G2E0H7_PHACM|nr:putative integral membrane protein [Phaeomoniella chlamydospora]